MSDASIRFFTEKISFNLKGKRKLRRWIDAAILFEKYSTGEINFIFCDDPYLALLNKKFLSHDTFTDIITFDNSEAQGALQGDIYISIDRVKENAKLYGVSFVNELNRVMIHGILHLCGYKDKTATESKEMRRKEDYYLSLLPGF